MPRSPLTIDAALALLDGYEEEDESVVAVCGLSAIDESARSLVTPPVTTVSTTDRFKRARERKKRELSVLRTQSRGLEETLRRLKQERLAATSSDQIVWRQAALRQQSERDEAEQLNAQLKQMIDATLKQTRRLRAMLAYPESLAPLVHHKRLHPHPERTAIASLVEFGGLLITLDLLELQIDDITAHTHGMADASMLVMDKVGEHGCRLMVDAVDASVVPYDLSAASECAWRRLAFDNLPDDICVEHQSTVSRTYGMDVVNGPFQLSYTGSAVYRKRILGDGRVVILWASEWEPVGLEAWCDITHESARRQGFLCLSPSTIDPMRFTSVQTFYRIERDACGDPTCVRGAFGDDSVPKAEHAIADCVANEIKRLIQGIESDLIGQHSGETSTGRKTEQAVAPCVKQKDQSMGNSRTCDVTGGQVVVAEERWLMA